ncbi:MAG: class B sortase [Clostridia bacterium]|nr:class B sortase [Clostridia bacterium]
MSAGSKRKKAILIFLASICAVALLVSLYFALKDYLPQRQEQSRFSELRQIVEQEKSETNRDDGSVFSPLEEHNSDFVGWLKIEDTQIDYPVVKSSEDDPEYYLRRDFDKNYSYSGTPFIGSGCDEYSDVFIIYAHNMKNGTMFTDLDKYADASWAKEHRDFEFSTLREKRTYRVFAAFKTEIGSDGEFKYYEYAGNLDSDDYKDAVAKFAEHSETAMDDIPDEKAQLLILSTCSYHTDNGRFAIVAYRIK